MSSIPRWAGTAEVAVAASPIDAGEFALVMAQQVASIQDLEVVFLAHQDTYLPITPPVEGFVLQQPRSVDITPFDPNAFPVDFVRNLNASYENSVAVYPLTVAENPITRSIEFFNAAGQVIYSIPSPVDYNPYAYLNSLYPRLSLATASSDAIRTLRALYDPSRILLKTKLIALENVEFYLHTRQSILEAKTALALMESDEGGMMLMMEGDSESNIVCTAMETIGDPVVTIAYPVWFTNRLDVFTCSDLLPETWTLAARELDTVGTNPLTWIDTNGWLYGNPAIRHYTAGNADLDSDGDGYADAREMLVYRTDETDSNAHPIVVSGEVTYGGTETGRIYVLVVDDADSWSLARSINLPAEGFYTNSEVGGGASYWFKAFRDVESDGIRTEWEPWGVYDDASLLVTGDLTGIDITLRDVSSIWGTLSYSGPQTGDLHVVAVTQSNGWDAIGETVIPWEQGLVSTTGGVIYLTFPTDFALVGLPATDCWLRAYIDTDGNSSPTFGEAVGLYSTQAIPISNRITGADFNLLDPDSDGDGMPDWWELKYQLNPVESADATADGDGDGLSNADEYSQGTAPFGLQDLDAPRAKVLIHASGLYRIAKEQAATALGMTVNEVTNTTFSLRIQGTAVPTLRDQ
ncbi:MAG: hypothetical protein KDL31_12635, partial [Kiritimatiellae bacterium]|nr:hypothetical protein [Kiritimatiellia bacterium]